MEASTCDWTDLPCNISALILWLYDFFMWLPRKLFELLAEGIDLLFQSMPVPDFLEDGQAILTALGNSEAMFWLSIMKVPAGFTMIMGALIARFILRRIPLIG